MAKTGILIHVRHLETQGWQRLMWGEPDIDKFGCLPMLVWLLLHESRDEPVADIIIGQTAGCSKDGLSDAAYAKRFFLERFDRLPEFARIAARFGQLSQADIAHIRQRIAHVEEMPPLRNTRDEVIVAAKFFARKGVDKILQLSSANHTPRCIQEQSLARAEGSIPAAQIWSAVADDMCFDGSTPLTTLVLEKPHRGDDPMLGVTPSAPEVLRGYLRLSSDAQREFVDGAQALIEKLQTKS